MQATRPFAYQRIPTDHPGLMWGAGTKVVDDNGYLLPVFRGQHGAHEHWSETRLGSLSFGSAEAASLYAMQPNDRRMAVQTPKVFPVFLDIRNPFVASGDDPFMDLSRYAEVFGIEETIRIAVKFKDYVEHTNAWEELQPEHGSVENLAATKPELLLELYFEVYALLDDPEEVARLRAAGFDGAIHGGSGETAMEAEYRVFSVEQVRSVWDMELTGSI
ncbi:hypothetical protein [Burkholderia ubonensis]|uniref:hypothetical protein n=1 Tax=Burkholderia ubonensis TaxID=101571 RepID=UPI000B183EBA|nr:hypothetical protein [Burkholderia ubonensis]